MAQKRATNVTARVTDYFRKHPNEVCNIFEIMRATGLSKDQIQYSIHRIEERTGMQIEIITRGQLYRWNKEEEAVNVKVLTAVPEEISTSVKKLDRETVEFWYVGKTKDGREILRDALDMKLYTIEEI